MARYSVYLEESSDGSTMAHVAELLGCYSMAKTSKEALEKLPLKIRQYLDWLGAHGEPVPLSKEPIQIDVVKEVSTHVDVSDGDSEILLDHNQAPLADEELKTLLRLMNYAREDTIATLRDVSDEMLDWKSDPTTTRSIREIVAHLAYVEFWYLGKLWDESSTEGLLELPAEIRKVVVERLNKLTPIGRERKTTFYYVAPKPPEEWTARKIFRRYLWHERIHSKTIAKLIELYRSTSKGA